ncbi:MAG: M15 family metallopeptidase [Oscillospiraceae bacterium]|nr:M15 family metallopeptidase [Oscillospiraceae bacterium]
MRKLFGVTLVITVLLAIMGILFGNHERPNETQTLHRGNQQTIEAYISAPESSAVPPDILLVNAWNPLPGDFSPEEFVNLFDYKDRSFGLSRSDIQLDKAVLQAADAMFAAAKRDGVNGFIITSGYRDRERQMALYNEDGSGMVAFPGYSEHETGLAFDVTVNGGLGDFHTTTQFEWLILNCWDYGFILRYPEDKEHITGIPYEPWHYRYVGITHSQAIRNENITLEEYLGQG